MQQLVMESLGKEFDLDGKLVNQGLNVFGNKGGTDAHAFIQQLNDGRDDFFVTFIEVFKDPMAVQIDKGITMGDFLHGFEAGLANALKNKGRQVIEMSIPEVNEFALGMLIALYERAVAVYAEYISINAFHQPGVQAYKLASKSVIDLLLDIEKKLASLGEFGGSAAELGAKLGLENLCDAEGIFAKLAENSGERKYDGFSISRSWDKSKGWVYSVTK
jgi:glucose-6-phosphate isomerase